MDVKKEQRAIDWLKTFEPSDGYYLAYSGGKDSDVILTLAQLANVKFEAHHNLTTVDAPETVYYVRGKNNVIIDSPKKTMWQLIVEKRMPPTRMIRYCCEALKERGGAGKVKVTGVRWAESVNRKSNQGHITITNKSKKVKKLADEIGANFTQTNRGGWF